MKKSLLVVVIILGLIAVFAVTVFKAPETTLTLSSARAELPAQSGDVLHVFVSIRNGALPDTLVGASSDIARTVTLMAEPSTTAVPIPANSSPVLSEDGAFIELTGVEGDLEEGQLIPISFEFETSGPLATRATISVATDPHAAHRAMMAAGTTNMKLLEDGQNIPTADLKVTPMADGTWAVRLDVAHFTFDEDTEDPVHVPGHGHAHLYINGLKLQRMYGPDATIGVLPAGEYAVRVSLNTNDHRPYLNNAGPVGAVANIVAQ